MRIRWMRGARLSFAILAVLALASCTRQQQAYYLIDAQTGQPVPVVAQQQTYMRPQYVQQPDQPAASDGGGLFSSPPAYAQPAYPQPAPQASGRGLFNSFGSNSENTQPADVPTPQSDVVKYPGPLANVGGPYQAVPDGYTAR
jgi:hypothetical protein